jgi:hypothetical protein
MISRLDRKIPGGKLLRVEVEVESGIVLRAIVRGDFFAHPEEAFEAAEGALAGLPTESLAEAALALFSEPPLKLFGAESADIARALADAAGQAGGA